MWKKIELSNSGEPGIFFTNDKEYGANPCFEISLRGRTMCNLTTINVEDVETQDDLNARAKGASFIATLQASYTNFHYLRESWKKNIEKDALIGVSMTGIASGKVMGLNLKEAAEIVKEENARVAELIGINKAARTTCVKPEGSASLVLGTSSGIHAYHNDYYLRRVRAGKNEAIYQYLLENHPELIEDEFFKPHLQAVISLPQRAPEGAITRHESALHLLDRVAKVWKTWVKTGHRKGANVNNVSTTISIKKNEWLEVGEWMWENRDNFTALACLPAEEDGHGYVQLPFEDITEDKYELLMKSLHKIDLTKVVELEDDTELQQTVACGGGSCQIV
jgi:ribonucleoside-diphosphate reductase alpha chain